MTNELTLAKRPQLTAEIIQTAMIGGEIFYEARMFGAPSKEAATAFMLKSFELGLPMTAGFDLMYYINNRVTLSPRGCMALIQASGKLSAMTIDEQPESCTVTMTRNNGISYSSTFTLEMARTAGLVKAGGAWDKYLSNMLRARATGTVAMVLFPDIIAGLYTADAFGAAVDDDGNVIDGGFVDADS